MNPVLIGLLMSIMMIASPMAGCLGGIDDLLEELESFGDCIVYYDGVEENRMQYQLEILNTTENESVDNNSINSTNNSNNSSDNMENITTSNEVWNITFYDARNETLENECATQGFVYTGDIQVFPRDDGSCDALVCECDRRYCDENNNTLEIDWDNMTDADRCRWDGGSWETLNNTTTEGACVIICYPEEWNTTSNSTLNCRDGETRISPDGCNECVCDNGNWSCTEKACENSEEEREDEETHRCNEENTTSCED